MWKIWGNSSTNISLSNTSLMGVNKVIINKATLVIYLSQRNFEHSCNLIYAQCKLYATCSFSEKLLYCSFYLDTYVHYQSIYRSIYQSIYTSNYLSYMSRGEDSSHVAVSLLVTHGRAACPPLQRWR